MFEVYTITPAGRLGNQLLWTDREANAINLLNRLRGQGTPHLYAVDGIVHHEFGPEHTAIIYGEDE